MPVACFHVVRRCRFMGMAGHLSLPTAARRCALAVSTAWRKPDGTGRYTPARLCGRTDMARELREDPYIDEGGDIGEDLSNQPPNEDDTSNE